MRFEDLKTGKTAVPQEELEEANRDFVETVHFTGEPSKPGHYFAVTGDANDDEADPPARASGPLASIPWTATEDDALAHVTLADVAAAQAYWREHAPSEFRNLLDATEDDEVRE